MISVLKHNINHYGTLLSPRVWINRILCSNTLTCLKCCHANVVWLCLYNTGSSHSAGDVAVLSSNHAKKVFT